MKKVYLLLFIAIAGFEASLLSSCGGAATSSAKVAKSSKTGWAYNKRENGGFEVHKKVPSSPGPGLVPIEGGTFVMGGSADVDLGYEQNNLRRRITVSSFYIDETETSNIDWLEYLHWIRKNFPDDREYYHEALPDTLVWRRALSYNEPYVDNYLRHPAYGDYPVVGITWEQAQAYCVWRTDRVNEEILRNKGVLMDWKTLANGGNAKGSRSSSSKGGRGGASASKGRAAAKTENGPAANTDSVKPFNTDVYLAGQYRGAMVDGPNMPISLMATPKQAGASASTGSGRATSGRTSGGRGSASSRGASSSKAEPVKRTVGIEDGILKQPYRLPTEAEWEYAALALVGNTDYENVADGKIYPWSGLGVRSSRQESRGLMLANFKRRGGDLMGTGGYLNDKYAITAPVRSFVPNDFGLYNMAGNVSEWTADVYRQMSFQQVEDLNPFRGNEYSHRKVTEDGKQRKVVVDRHGVPLREAAISNKKLSWNEMMARTAAPKTQVADSAALDSAGSGAPSDVEQSASSGEADIKGKPFTADVRDFRDTSTNNLYGVITLVNNKSRVYKGASWNDRAYWLNPATRRYMQQDESSAEIGFRCAMTMVGSSEIYTEGKPQLRVKPTAKLTDSKRKKGVINLGKRNTRVMN